MRRVVILVIGGIACAAAGYLAAYAPEHRRVAAAESQLAATRAELVAARSSVNTARLLGALLLLEEMVLIRTTVRHGIAPRHSSMTFAPSGRARPTPGCDGGPNAGLARSEPVVLALLREIEFQLRDALGYEVPERRPRTPCLMP